MIRRWIGLPFLLMGWTIFTIGFAIMLFAGWIGGEEAEAGMLYELDKADLFRPGDYG